jgi:uncharacterized protein YjiS (DUF1127 family)
MATDQEITPMTVHDPVMFTVRLFPRMLPVPADSLRRVCRAIARGLDKAFGALIEWPKRANQRRRLAELNHRELADMGISRADAWMEASKPFWRK